MITKYFDSNFKRFYLFINYTKHIIFASSYTNSIITGENNIKLNK